MSRHIPVELPTLQSDLDSFRLEMELYFETVHEKLEQLDSEIKKIQQLTSGFPLFLTVLLNGNDA